jgi:hypothetical protein
MSEDRRTSIRRRAALPFAWRPIPESASLTEICNALGLPPALALQSRLAELDDEFRRACAVLPDTRLAAALRVLDAKVAVLEEAVLAQSPHPDNRLVTISADGADFDSPDPLVVGSWLGVHLVLPVSYHIVCRGQVSHCHAIDSGGFRVGVELSHLEAPAARRLTRYAIGREREGDD